MNERDYLILISWINYQTALIRFRSAQFARQYRIIDSD